MTAALILIPIAVRPCKTCGASDRNASGRCRPCVKRHSANSYQANKAKSNAKSAAWRESNLDKARSLCREWNKAHADKVNAGARARRAANPDASLKTRAAWSAANNEKIKAQNTAWRRANIEIVRAYYHNRQARKAETGGTLSRGLSKKLFKLQRGMCPCCNQPLGNDYHLDHKIPIIAGGSNTDDNMQLLRKICNLQKGSKDPIAFMQQRGFLI